MFEWIQNNADALNVVASTGMLLVWLVYLQVFLYVYRRQTTASILVSLNRGAGADARCVICNMSAEAIYLQSLICTLAGPSIDVTTSVSRIDELTAPEGTTADAHYQEPVHPGHCIDVGRFSRLVRMIEDEADAGDPFATDRVVELKVQVVAIYGSDDLPVSAERTFDVVVEDDTTKVWPKTVETRQVRSIRQRRKLRAQAESYGRHPESR